MVMETYQNWWNYFLVRGETTVGDNWKLLKSIEAFLKEGERRENGSLEIHRSIYRGGVGEGGKDISISDVLNMTSFHCPYSGYQLLMSGTWTDILSLFQTPLSTFRTSMSLFQTSLSIFQTSLSGHQFYEKFDVRNMDSKNWPYSRHQPGHISDTAEGQAMGLDPTPVYMANGGGTR